VRIVVNTERCKGHAQCEIAAPQVFRLNDAGVAEILQQSPAESLRLAVENAAQRCPERAIIVDTTLET
jgi:ferredoxin